MTARGGGRVSLVWGSGVLVNERGHEDGVSESKGGGKGEGKGREGRGWAQGVGFTESQEISEQR